MHANIDDTNRLTVPAGFQSFVQINKLPVISAESAGPSQVLVVCHVFCV